MSEVISFGQSIINGVSHVFSGISSTLTSLPSTIGNAVQDIANALLSIPSDIVSFFSQLGASIVFAFHIFANYLYQGINDIAGAFHSFAVNIKKGIDNIAKTFEDIGVNIYSAFSTVYNFFVNLIGGIINYLHPIVEFFTNLFNGIQSTINTLINIAMDLPTFFNMATNFFEQLFTGALLDIANLPSYLAKQEASRLATAIDDITQWNIFTLLTPRVMEGIAKAPIYGDPLKSLFSKTLGVILSPIATLIASQIAKSIIGTAFSNVKTSQPQPYNVKSTLPSIQPPSLTLPSIPGVSTPSKPSLQAQTPPQYSQTFKPAHTLSIHVKDVMQLLVNSVGLRYGGYNLAQMFTSVIESFIITAEYLPVPLTPLLAEVTDLFESYLTMSYAENVSPITDNVNVQVLATAEEIVLPPNEQLCLPQTPSPTGYSGETLTDTVYVNYQLCIPFSAFAYNLVTVLAEQVVPPPLPSGLLQNVNVSSTQQIPPPLPSQLLDNVFVDYTIYPPPASPPQLVENVSIQTTQLPSTFFQTTVQSTSVELYPPATVSLSLYTFVFSESTSFSYTQPQVV